MNNWRSAEPSTGSLYVGIVYLENRFGDHRGQLIYVHEEAPQVLSSDRRHVDYVPVIRVYPEVSRVDPLEAVAAEWTGLGS